MAKLGLKSSSLSLAVTYMSNPNAYRLLHHPSPRQPEQPPFDSLGARSPSTLNGLLSLIVWLLSLGCLPVPFSLRHF